MRTILAMSASLALMALPVAVSAHHSAAQFDFNKTVKLEGVVKEISVANPHISLVLEVNDEKGRHDVAFEGHSRNNVYRRGWRPNLVHVGDTITIEVAPARSGEEGGYVKNWILADGTEF